MDKLHTAAPGNRRNSQRRKPRSTVQVQCRRGMYGLGSNMATGTLDISETGVRLVISEELEPPDEVEIIVGGYGVQKPLKRTGVVRWALKLENGQFCIGVEFQKRLDFRLLQSLACPG
jgi:PilZ domain